MNPPPYADHTRFIVGCILIIVLVCLGCGTYLFISGYQSGELMIGIASAGAGSLGTMVAMRRQNNQTEITNSPSNPVPTTNEATPHS